MSGASYRVVMFHPFVSESAVQAVEKVIRSRWIGQGQLVADFETAVRSRLGAPHACAVNHVSAAIRLALAIIGVGPGDEVITTPQTCTATNHPILEQFAVPVFADIHMLTGNIDPPDIEHRITEKTKAVICCHWGGYPADMDEIHAAASRHNLPVIEDASDALGAVYKGRPIGGLSPFTCLNFQAIQQVTSAEGGMLLCRSADDHETALRRRWFGIDRLRRTVNQTGYFDFDVTETGFGYHLTNVAAAIGLANFAELDTILDRRRLIAARYRKELGRADGVTLMQGAPDRESAWQLFTVHVARRGDFHRALQSRGIETSIVHNRNDVYGVFGGRRSDLPHLDQFNRSFICIPLHNQLTDDQVGRVIDAVKEGW